MRKIVNISETAYVVVMGTVCISKSCDTCDGRGIVFLKKRSFECPDCGGTGSRNEYPRRWFARGPASLVSVYMEAEDGFEERYKYSCSVKAPRCDSTEIFRAKADDVFSDREAAIHEAERRNSGTYAKVVGLP